MSSYTSAELAEALADAGMPEDKIPTAVAIAWGESSGQKNAVCNNCLGVTEYSVGPWQINLRAHPQVTPECAKDPQCAAQFVTQLSNEGRDFSPWTVFTSGRYQDFMDRVSNDLSDWFSGDGAGSSSGSQSVRINEYIQSQCGDRPSLTDIPGLLDFNICQAQAVVDWTRSRGEDIADNPVAGLPGLNDANMDSIIGDLSGGVAAFIFDLGRTLAPYAFFLGLALILIIAGTQGLLGDRVKDAGARVIAAYKSRGASEATT